MEAQTLTTDTFATFIPSNVPHSRYYKDYDESTAYALWLVRTYFCSISYIYEQGAVYFVTPYKGSDNYIASVRF